MTWKIKDSATSKKSLIDFCNLPKLKIYKDYQVQHAYVYDPEAIKFFCIQR